MVTNQFTIYTASDPNGPGYLYGSTGSLPTILDACLVNGYTGKPAAGWTKPLPNITGSTSASIYACYQQGTGSGFVLFINDSGEVGGISSECWACGWESISSLTGSGTTIATNVGVGNNQFPSPAQSLTYGVVNIRKSVTMDSTSKRYWIIAADGATMYMWINTGDSAAPAQYMHWSFGDCYSLLGPSDLWNCYIYGRAANNSGVNTNNDYTDMIPFSAYIYPGGGTTSNNAMNLSLPGHYIARNGYGAGSSTGIGRRGAAGISNLYINGGGTVFGNQISGLFPSPNPLDQSLYMSPLWVTDPLNFSLRGRYRGLYQVCHPATNFIDGQVISGSIDYAGKAFVVVRGSPYNSFWAIETTPTLEFN